MRALDLKKPWPIVYVDVDGVLADLFTHIAEIHDVDHYSEMSKTEWEHFLEHTDAFKLFSNLPAFPTVTPLLRMVVDMFGSYRILSSPLNYDEAASIAGKKEWLHKNVSIPAEAHIFDRDKFKYAVQADGTPNILIDDWKKNTIPWQQHGGIAIKWQADQDSLEYLHQRLTEAKAKFQ